MRLVCLGYFDEETLDSMDLEEVNAFVDECIAYGKVVGKHIAGLELLQSTDYAKTVQSVDGKVVVNDGSAVKMEKVLVPVITLEVDNFDQAVDILSIHPALKKGCSFEIRRVDDIKEMKEQMKK